MLNKKELLLHLTDILGSTVELLLRPRAVIWRMVFEMVESESPIKSAVYKLHREGLLKRRAKGNFGLSEKGSQLLRSFPDFDKVGQKKWAGRWSVVSFDVPEENRRSRDYLREALKNRGFGQMHKSVWISPCADIDEVKDLLETSYCRDYTLIFTGELEEGTFLPEFINRVWPNLKRINEEYARYVETWRKRIENFSAAKFESAARRKEVKQVLREVARRELALILREDPILPRGLEPQGWKRQEALSLVRSV